MNLVKSSLRHPAVTITLVAMVFLAGVVSLLKMPRREDPKITIRAGLVMASYPGATAEQVEAQVTRKIEERLFRFAEVKKRKTFSTSRDGMVIVQLELEDWVSDPDQFWSKLRHDMNELKARELPQEVLGVTVDGDFGDTVAQLIAVSGARYGYRELKDYAGRIEDALRTISATSKIKRYGEQREQIEVATSLARLSQYRVTPGQIVNALQKQNLVEFAGSIETERGDVPLQTTGLFQREEQVRRLMVDVSPLTGQPVYLGDFTDVRRRYEDPASFVRVNGNAAIMLSVEMQDGGNVVEFGEAVEAKLAEVRRALPPDLAVTLVADQPRVVEERISHFDREFLIAIVAVVLVTMVLLPWRVATIAAVAIPVTIAVTFAALDAVGVELHQVSIAALIVVLGMVVDDAIVIADNYVELLDHGLSRADAAWRSASDLAAPVLAATLTIIASFLPLAWLSATTGEFIRALPITVAVSLLCSYAVAMLLTPLLAYAFIKTGLRPHAPVAKRRFSPLDAMERLYDWAIRRAMPRKTLTLAAGVGAFVAGILLMRAVGDRFFPLAERDQFVIDVWLPEGSRIGATDAAVRRIEQVVAKTRGVTDVASIVGAGAPRFYYAISPELSTPSYAQLVVNTTSPDTTPSIVRVLSRALPAAAPEAHVMVKELEQGATSPAPVEIRITAADLDTLRALAARVRKVLERTPGAVDVTTDFRDDTYRLAVSVDQEAASRVGLTSAAISRHLAGGFEGAPVSTFWEGSRAVDIALRLDEGERRRFDDIEDMYVTSEMSGMRVPLKQVASLTPVWGPSRIVHRNGLRTMTVRSRAADGVLASSVLASARAVVDTMSLPAGASIAYGGEYENQTDTEGEMHVALGISLLLIFLILLLQFRSIRLPLVVMASIPLSVVGAVLGLVLTHNPFSFTAFLGVIGLMGLVVRNAIILVDYMNAEIAAGVPVEQAAIDAGRRRLRPIFLTTMAAAAGVLPMILSGSSMWAPLASVLAMGLITSMVFTLIVVPVLYVVVVGGRGTTSPSGALGMAAAATVALCVALPARSAHAQQPATRLTLDEAVAAALRNNAGVRAARSRVDEALARRRSATRAMLPSFGASFQSSRSASTQRLTFAAGALGTLPGTGAIPATDVDVEQGGQTASYGAVSVTQPLTTLFRIRANARAARADELGAAADARDTELDVALAVEKLYYGLLVAQQRRRAASLRADVAQESLQHRVHAVAAGTRRAVSELEGRTAALDARQSLLAADDEIDDLSARLTELLGAPVPHDVELAAPERSSSELVPNDLTVRAMSQSPAVVSAALLVRKANAGIAAARATYLPDVALFGQEIYQTAVPFLARTNFVFGVKAEWTVFDFGRRESNVAELRAARRTAEANLDRVKQHVASEIEQARRKVERAERGAALAREMLSLRREAARVAGDRSATGAALDTDRREAEAAVASAEAEWLAAEAGRQIALAELRRAAGVSDKRGVQ